MRDDHGADRRAYAQARPHVGLRSGPRFLGGKVADRTRHAWTRYWTRRAEHATVAILHALDDRTLKDIGLDRSEIESLVHGTDRSERRICWAPAGERCARGCC